MERGCVHDALFFYFVKGMQEQPITNPFDSGWRDDANQTRLFASVEHGLLGLALMPSLAPKSLQQTKRLQSA
jgi:hypothetical protein